MGSTRSLERLLFAHQKKQIAALVQPASSAFRAYERRYQRATRQWREVIEPEDIVARARAADIVYVGDYHTLRAAQHAFAELVEASLDGSRRVVIALELVEGARQGALDAFLAGRISERTLRRRLGHLQSGGFELWPGLRRILQVARRHRLQVVAIDRRAGGHRSLERRDRYAAGRIAEVAAAEDRPRLFVLMGQFHVAPAHLPRQVEAALGDDRRSRLIVYQNAEAPWWGLARRGLAGRARAVAIDGESVCLFTASPVVCQRSFLDYVEAEAGDAPLEPTGLSETFRLLARSIGRLVGVRVAGVTQSIEVVTSGELGALDRVARRGRLSRGERAALERRVVAGEATFEEKAGIVWLPGLSLNHAAEEAVELVRWVALGRRGPPKRDRTEGFWAACFEAALRFFGSRLVNPARRAPALEVWIHRYREGRAAARQEAAYVLAFTATLAGEAEVPPPLPPSPAMRARLAQALGQLVGDALAHGFFARGGLPRRVIRAMFADPLEVPSRQFLLLARRFPPARSTGGENGRATLPTAAKVQSQGYAPEALGDS